MVDIKNIILIGRTGGGKSTLANVLVNKNDNFDEIFTESAGGTSKTREIKEEIVDVFLDRDHNEKISYRFIDTVGIGDTRLTLQGVLSKLTDIAECVNNEGLNQILFVTSGRFTKEEILAYDLLSSVIFDGRILDYTTVVRTNFPDFENEAECEKDRQNLRNESPELAHILNRVKIIHVDNPPMKGRMLTIAKEIREVSNIKLITYLGTCRKNYKPAEDFYKLKERVQYYKTNEEKLKEKIKELEQARKKYEEEFRKELAIVKEKQAQELLEVKKEQDRKYKELDEKQAQELQKVKDELWDMKRLKDELQKKANNFYGPVVIKKDTPKDTGEYNCDGNGENYQGQDMGLSLNEVWLCIPCPVSTTGCSSTFRNPINWYHCHGRLKINTCLDIICDDCGNISDWREWRFKCDNENHKFYEKITDDLDFIYALGSVFSLRHMSSDKRRVVMQIINKLSSFEDTGKYNCYEICEDHQGQVMSLSSTEAWLYIHCPISTTGCSAVNKNPTYWRHCHGRLKINTGLDIICDDCGNINDWREWRFKCDNENHKFHEKITEDLDFINALGSLLSLRHISSDKRRVVVKIINKLAFQC